MTEAAAMTDDDGSPYLRREPRSEAEAREDVLRRVVADVKARRITFREGRQRMIDVGMHPLNATSTLRHWLRQAGMSDDAINAALREGGEDE